MPNPFITLPIDGHIAGQLSCQSFLPPAGCITKDAIPAAAGIEATKLQHQHQHVLSQPLSAMTAGTTTIHVARGATGTVEGFRCGSITPAIGAATATVDLKKNGATILSGTITLNNANAAYVAVNGAILTPGLVAGDVLTVVTTATAGGGTLPTGFFATVTVREDAS